MVATGKSSVWIFGFGSLIYKAGFKYAERLEGYIKGYKYVVFWRTYRLRHVRSAGPKPLRVQDSLASGLD